METSLTPIKEKRTSGAHVTYWIETVPSEQFQPLLENLQADVVVVGGGIAGISVAYALCKANKKVIVLEDGLLGSGETGRTSAHLVTALDDRYGEIERIFGEEGAKLAADSHATAIDKIEQIVRDEDIDCDFQRLSGYLFLHPSDEWESLEKEFEAAKRAGVNIEKVKSIPGILAPVGGGLKFNNQAQFHPLKYIHGLAQAIVRMGGKIFTETHVSDVGPTGITTEAGFKIEAAHIVVATNAPINSTLHFPLKQFAYRSYIIAAKVPKGMIEPALWWDSGDLNANDEITPYHYVRLCKYDDNSDLLICGGEDHLTGKSEVPEEDLYSRIENWAGKHFPIGEIVMRWSGQIMETIDCISYIGRAPGKHHNMYVVTGDSGNGITHSAIAGMLITDLIQGKPNKWEKLYDPSRLKVFKSGKTWLKEFIGGFMDYIKTSPENHDSRQITGLKKEEGILVKMEGRKYGVYRDSENHLHWVSAKCTHGNCTVKWNNDEKTWDCPCHGCRFATDGTVLNGPSNENLEYHKEIHPEALPKN